jgi:hypothetical protein
MWGSTVSNVLKNKLDMVENYKSVREVLNSWEKKELLEMGSRPNLEKDYWAREFKWEVQRKDEELLVKITSAGKNGVWENGGGDDLFVEIRVVRDGQPIVTLNREKTPLAP